METHVLTSSQREIFLIFPVEQNKLILDPTAIFFLMF